MITLRKPLLAIMLLSLLSCANQGIEQWPQSVPSRQYFEQSYLSNSLNQQRQSEQEYLNWIIEFYQGSLLFPTGWEDVEATMLAITPSGEQQRLSADLRDLGAGIAAEWARHNDLRLIDNRLLALWGSMLQLAADSQQQSRYIEVISSDIGAILARQLDPNDVNSRRYEQFLEMPGFADF